MANRVPYHDEDINSEAQLPLHDFFNILKQSGFSVTSSQIEDTIKLLQQFASSAKNETELVHYIAPIFASNEEEQFQFNELFRKYFVSESLGKEPKFKKSSLAKLHFNIYWKRYLMLIVSLLLIGTYLAYKSIVVMKPVFTFIRNDGNREAEDFFQVSANEVLNIHIKESGLWAQDDSSDIKFTSFFDWGDGQQNANSSHRYQVDGLYTLKAYIRYHRTALLYYNDTIEQTIKVCSEQADLQIENSQPDKLCYVGQAISLKANATGRKPDRITWEVSYNMSREGDRLDTVFTKQGTYHITCYAVFDSIKSACTIKRNLDLYVKDTTKVNLLIQASKDAKPIPIESKLKSFWLWLSGLATLILLLLTILFSSLWNKAKNKIKQVVVQRSLEYNDLINSFKGNQAPMEVPFRSKNYMLLPEADIAFIARQMRQRINFDETILDIPKTITKSIHSGGLLQPVNIARTQQSEYLILIDNSIKNNQQVKLIEFLIETLVKQNVLIDKFYFKNEPTVYFSSNEMNGISLEKLSAKYSQHILLICGQGDQFLFPHYPILDTKYAELLSRWKRKAIITPIPFPDWKNKELNIWLPQMPIVPLDLQGLLVLMQMLFNDNKDTLHALENYNDHFYRTSHIDFEDIDELKKYCNEATWANTIDEDVTQNVLFQWLAAVAVYPKIRWELLVAIGKEILGKYAKSDQLNFTNLLRIARIKWMSDGQFPDYIRLDLLKNLKPENEIIAREVILQLLVEIPHEECNKVHFAFEEMEIQRITNEFNLYAYDPIKYANYKNSRDQFERLWNENKVLDSPSKVYFKNPHIAWENLIQLKDEGTKQLDRATMPIAGYFDTKTQQAEPENKLLLFLTGLSAMLFFVSLLAFIFFNIINLSGSNRFPQFLNTNKTKQTISFKTYMPELSSKQPMTLCFNNDCFDSIQHEHEYSVSLLSGDTMKRVSIVINGEEVYDTNLVITTLQYDVIINDAKPIAEDKLTDYEILLKQTAVDLNKKCPLMVDNETRLDSTRALQNNIFQYHYTLVNTQKDYINAEELKKNLQPIILKSIQTSADLKIFKDNGTTLSYRYFDKYGSYLFELTFTVRDYSQVAKKVDTIATKFKDTLKTSLDKNDNTPIDINSDLFIGNWLCYKIVDPSNKKFRLEVKYLKIIEHANKGAFAAIFITDKNDSLKSTINFYTKEYEGDLQFNANNKQEDYLAIMVLRLERNDLIYQDDNKTYYFKRIKEKLSESDMKNDYPVTK